MEPVSLHDYDLWRTGGAWSRGRLHGGCLWTFLFHSSPGGFCLRLTETIALADAARDDLASGFMRPVHTLSWGALASGRGTSRVSPSVQSQSWLCSWTFWSHPSTNSSFPLRPLCVGLPETCSQRPWISKKARADASTVLTSGGGEAQVEAAQWALWLPSLGSLFTER